MTRVLAEWIGVLALVVGLGLIGYQGYSLFARHKVDRLAWDGVANLQISEGVFTVHSSPDNLAMLRYIERHPKAIQPEPVGIYGWRNRWLGYRAIYFAKGEKIWAFNFTAIFPGLFALLVAWICYQTYRRQPQPKFDASPSKDPWSENEG
jgi:hypothetical protein